MVEAVVDGHNDSPRPAAQVISECLARSNGAVSPLDGLSCKISLHFCIQPHAIFTAPAKVTIEIGRGVEGIPTQQNLRNWRVTDCEIAGREQNIGAGVSNELRQFTLFKPEPLHRARGYSCIKHADAGQAFEFAT